MPPHADAKALPVGCPRRRGEEACSDLGQASLPLPWVFGLIGSLLTMIFIGVGAWVALNNRVTATETRQSGQQTVQDGFQADTKEWMKSLSADVKEMRHELDGLVARDAVRVSAQP